MPIRRCGATHPFLLLVGVAVLLGGSASGQPGRNETAPPIRLYGIVTQDDGGLALLQFGEARPVALRMGESRRGFVVRQVLADRIRLEAPDGRTLDIELPAASLGGDPSPAPHAPPEPELSIREPPPPALTTPEPPPADTNPAAAAPDRGERQLSRDDVRLRLQSELPRILSSAVVAPRLLGNEVVGLELVAFPLDTVLGETGLVPGDVLLAVNGREVRGAESLAVLVQRFQTASRIEITVDRNGEIFPLRYRIE